MPSQPRAFTVARTWWVRLKAGQRYSALIAIGAVLALGTMAGIAIWDERERDIDSAERALSHLSLTLTETMARTMQGLDLILMGLQDRIADAGVATTDDLREKFASEAVHRLLLDRIHDVPQIDALVIADDEGRLVNFSRGWPIPADREISDRDFFIAHRDASGLGPFIGEPVLNRITGEWTMFLTRRLDGPGGEFLGVVVGVIKTQYFEDFFRAVVPGEEATISLFRRDGVLLARYPESRALLGRSFGVQPLFTQILANANFGIVHTPASAFDGIARIMTPRVVDGFPLIINVTNTQSAILAGWHRKAIFILLMTGVAIGLIVLAGVLLARQFDNRMRMTRLQAEQEVSAGTERQIRALNKTLDTHLQQLRAITDNLPVLIAYNDCDRKIRFINKTGERWYARPAREILGKSVAELLGRPHLLAASNLFERLFKGPVRYERTAEYPDGKTRTVDVLNVPDTGPDGKLRGYYVLLDDVTERRATEEQLRQSQNLEAIGKLTGGVSHDFNNLLQVILGNSELLVAELIERPDLRKLAEMTRIAAERGAELTNRLLAFARRQSLEPTAVDINRLVAGMEGLLRRTLREEIEIEFVRGGGLWEALVDSAQLESALLNLCINARDAIENGGRVTIETANVRLDQDYCDQNVEVTPGPYVMIAVSDTGIGIPPQNLDRVFDPFFTTKEVGKGTGLGLSMVYGFVKQSRGHVKVYSEVGHGTTVRLYLPKADRPADAIDEAPASLSDLRGSQTILVVEDNDLVRGHVESQLANLGYRVICASNGAAAMEIVRQSADIDLLFTDVIMPGGMNGRDLAEAARKLRPAIKVLYTSGYTENAVVHHGRLDDGIQLLSKPYKTIELARKIRAVLSMPA